VIRNYIHLLKRNPRGRQGAAAGPVEAQPFHLTPGHLTDAQFTDLLLGAIPAQVASHLEACGQCAEEVERVSGAIGSFEQQSRLWAERRVAAQPMRAPGRQTLLAWLNVPGGRAAWAGAALAIVLVAGIGIGIGIGHRGGQTAALRRDQRPVAALLPGPAASAPEVPTATLKADNALLSAIDGDLSAEAAPSPSAYGLTVGRSPARARPAKGIPN